MNDEIPSAIKHLDFKPDLSDIRCEVVWTNVRTGHKMQACGGEQALCRAKYICPDCRQPHRQLVCAGCLTEIIRRGVMVEVESL